jgi:ATP-dependent DNA ligase
MPNNLREQLSAMGLPRGTVLDGEIWNPLKRGSWRHDKSVTCQLTLWDAIRVGGQDLSRQPLEERHAALTALMREEVADVKAVEHLPANMETLSAIREEAVNHWKTEELRSGFIHGVVLKRKGSPRRDHCSRCVEHADWLKIVFFSQN